jgi:hypothetical protein
MQTTHNNQKQCAKKWKDRSSNLQLSTQQSEARLRTVFPSCTRCFWRDPRAHWMPHSTRWLLPARGQEGARPSWGTWQAQHLAQIAAQSNAPSDMLLFAEPVWTFYASISARDSRSHLYHSLRIYITGLCLVDVNNLLWIEIDSDSDRWTDRLLCTVECDAVTALKLFAPAFWYTIPKK